MCFDLDNTGTFMIHPLSIFYQMLDPIWLGWGVAQVELSSGQITCRITWAPKSEMHSMIIWPISLQEIIYSVMVFLRHFQRTSLTALHLWHFSIFRHGSAFWILKPKIQWRFVKFVTIRPTLMWRYSKFITVNWLPVRAMSPPRGHQRLVTMSWTTEFFTADGPPRGLGQSTS